MSHPSPMERCDELFETLEVAAAGLYTLGDLVRHANQQYLHESTLNGIGCLLITVSNLMLEASSEGYQYMRSPQSPP